jgi:hypothetical protein
MKFSTTLLFGILLLNQLYAQPVLERKHFPTTGDTAWVGLANPVLLNNRLGDSGPQQHWDYRWLESDSQLLVNYQSAFQTPYFFYFFNGFGQKLSDTLNLALLELHLIYNFYQANNSRFVAKGLGISYNGLPLAANYTDEDELYHFPMHYGRTDSTTFAFEAALPGLGDFKSQGWRKKVIDGWGKLQTPYGEFDCLRLKSTLQSRDSLEFQGLQLGFPARTEELYQWFSPDEKVPLLEIAGNRLGDTFIPSRMRFRENKKVVAEPPFPSPEQQPWLLYPNPASEMVQLQGPTHEIQGKILIFDGDGRLWQELSKWPAAGLAVDLWPAGMYTLQFSHLNQAQRMRLLVH